MSYQSWSIILLVIQTVWVSISHRRFSVSWLTIMALGQALLTEIETPILRSRPSRRHRRSSLCSHVFCFLFSFFSFSLTEHCTGLLNLPGLLWVRDSPGMSLGVSIQVSFWTRSDVVWSVTRVEVFILQGKCPKDNRPTCPLYVHARGQFTQFTFLVIAVLVQKYKYWHLRRMQGFTSTKVQILTPEENARLY